MPEATNGRGLQVVSVTLVYRDACSRTWCFQLFSEYAPVQFSNALCHDCSSFGYLIGNYPMGWLLQHYHSGRVFAISKSKIVLLLASSSQLVAATFLWGTIIISYVPYSMLPEKY